jgi:hypothetical protein
MAGVTAAVTVVAEAAVAVATDAPEPRDGRREALAQSGSYPRFGMMESPPPVSRPVRV